MTTKGSDVPCATKRIYRAAKGRASGSACREQLVYMGEEDYVYKPAFTSYTLTGGQHHTPAENRKRPVYRRIMHNKSR